MRGGPGAARPGRLAARRSSRQRSCESCATPDVRRHNGHRPHVVLIVGVNGTGKTTTVGKLARLIKDSGKIAADLRGRHVPRRGGRAARVWANARRRGLHPRASRRGSRGGRVRRDRGRQGAQPRRHPGRHRRPAAHARQPDDRARQDPAHRRARSRGRAARSAARARRDRRTERPGAGARVHDAWPA